MRKIHFSKRIIALMCLFIGLSVSMFTYANSYIIKDTYEISFYMNDNPVEEVKIDYQKELDDLRALYNNDDIQGRLIIPGTDIDEPILKGSDNDYYLNHNPYGEYQAEGSVYEDYRTSLHDRKILIFGHSSPNWDVPFNELEKYYDKSFYDTHKEIRIVTEDGVNVYEIFSVHVEVGDFSYMKIHLDRDTYNEYLHKYQDRSLYDTGVVVNDDDEMLLLQTCSNKSEYQGYKRKFLLVVAKKIREVK